MFKKKTYSKHIYFAVLHFNDTKPYFVTVISSAARVAQRK